MTAAPEPYILLLEDSDDDAELIKYALTCGRLHRRIARVQTREEFMRAISARPPDAFISDHGLPDFDGFEALNIAQLRCPEVPFVFVSGAMSAADVKRAFRHGATGFISKADLGGLLPVLARALGSPFPVETARTAVPASEAAPHRLPADKRLQLFVETINEDCSFYIINPTAHIIAWNGAARHVLGYTAEEMIGQPEDRLFAGDDLLAGMPAKVRADPTPYGHRGVRIRKNGTRCAVDATVTPLRDAAGEIFGHVVVLREVLASGTLPLPAAPGPGLEKAIRAIPASLTADRAAPSSPGLAGSPPPRAIDCGEHRADDYEADLAELMAAPHQDGCHVVPREQFVRLTRAWRSLDLELANRELQITEDLKRLSVCRRRVMDDEAALQKRLHFLSTSFGENRRGYR